MRALCSLTQPGVGREVNTRPSPKVLQQARNRIPVATSTLELHLGRLGSTFATFANKASWLGLLGLKVAANSVTLHS
jgi:hypothetical protein